MTRVAGEQAVVLHARAYRETSSLVNLLTARHGRIAAVAKGVRSARRAQSPQPFSNLLVSWSGRGSLVTLTAVETETVRQLHGAQIAAAFYVAELLMRLLAERESAPRLFAGTSWVMDSLVAAELPVDVVLRNFEKLLLDELGYGVDFGCDAESNAAVVPNAHYALVIDRGFVAAPPNTGYPGSVLLAIADADYRDAATRRAAKQIFRLLLDAQLDNKPLQSRRLLLPKASR